MIFKTNQIMSVCYHQQVLYTTTFMVHVPFKLIQSLYFKQYKNIFNYFSQVQTHEYLILKDFSWNPKCLYHVSVSCQIGVVLILLYLNFTG